jgi:hypothetical protein
MEFIDSPEALAASTFKARKNVFQTKWRHTPDDGMFSVTAVRT